MMPSQSALLQLLLVLQYQGLYSDFPSVVHAKEHQQEFRNSSIAKREIVTSCSKGWFPFNDMCYRIGGRKNEGRFTWYKGQEECVKYGGMLAVIHSQELNDFLASYIVLTEEDHMWFGMHSQNRPDFDYTWVDGSTPSYFNWEPNQPSSRDGGGTKQDCGVMIFAPGHLLRHTGQWDDADCNSHRPFICQKSKDIQRSRVYDPRICSDDGWKFKTSCFHLVNKSMPWSQAENHCKDHYGGNLASIQDFGWTTFLNFILRHNQNHNFWIGIEFIEDVQQWWSNGWPVAYTHWEEEEEEKISVGTCASLGTGRRWTVKSCATPMPFICETSSVRPPVLKAAPEGSRCPQIPNHKRSLQWRDLGGERCYYIDAVSRHDWAHANLYCTRMGGKLASIHSEEEVRMLHPFVKYVDATYHIGLYRTRIYGDDEFVWMDGSPYDFQYWDHREPSSVAEDCAELRTHAMFWNDVHCTNIHGFICSVMKISQNTSRAVEAAAPVPLGFSLYSVLGAMFCGALVSFLVSTVLYFSNIFSPNDRKNSAEALIHFGSSPEIVVKEDADIYAQVTPERR